MLRITGVTPPTLDQFALATFISDAALERHLRAMRRRYGAKRDVLVDALHTYLPEARVRGTAAGLHLLAELPAGADERAIGLRAREAGVAVHEVHRHVVGVALERHSRVSAGQPHVERVVHEQVRQHGRDR